MVEELKGLLQSGRYLAALRKAGPAARDLSLEPGERARAALVASAAAYYLRQYEVATEYAALARQQAGDQELQAKALHYHGAALAYFDPADAEGVLLQALAQDQTAYVADHRPAILHSLALVYERRRDPLAIEAYRQSAEAYLQQGKPGHSVRPLNSGAFLALLGDQIETGEALLSRATEHLEHALLDDVANHEAIRCYALWLQGERHEAITRAEDLLQPGREGTTPWAVTLGAIVAAEVALAEGTRNIASGFVGWALKHVTAAECGKLANLLGDLRHRVERGAES